MIVIGEILLYLDPGTGSLLISTLMGLSLTLLYFLKGVFYKFSYFFFGVKRKSLNDFSGEIVFFSEGKSYWRVYKPIINALVKNKQKVIYLSAEQGDEGLTTSSEYVKSYYLGNIKQAIFTLNRLKARICVLTTPQLDVVALKRSKSVDHYCHVIHAPNNIHAYKKFAFDYFDSVLCSSHAQIENLEYLEKKRKTKPKQLFQTGCTYYDVFKLDNDHTGDAILVAPTWGDKTFLKSCGKELISKLLEDGHKVIFRPHPQSWISDKELMDDLLTTFMSNSNLIIDHEVEVEKAIKNSKLLICDIASGMLFDMAFAYKKPIISVQFDWTNGGYEAADLMSDTSASTLLKEVGMMISEKEVKNISKIVDKVSLITITQEMIDKHIFNFQKAGIVASQQILSIFNEPT